MGFSVSDLFDKYDIGAYIYIYIYIHHCYHKYWFYEWLLVFIDKSDSKCYLLICVF